MNTQTDAAEEECPAMYCWCRHDPDVWWAGHASSSLMRWKPGLPVLRFPASDEGSR